MTPSTGKFVAELAKLGYDPTVIAGKSDHVIFDYVVESGKFAGRKVKLGFIVPPDFPATPPSGPHVSPHIHPISSGGGQHPTGAVHNSPFSEVAGGDWQYWSRPFRSNWGSSKRNVGAYMSHIWYLWDTQ